jgi:phosphatidylserine/phosphatidylglycerophosphate/cardiolipin synthase-like enzyme
VKKRGGASRRGSAIAESQLDLALPARAISMELVAGRGHYDRVLRAVLDAKVSIWIASANVKELIVEDRRGTYGSVLKQLSALAARGVELRLLHAEIPSRPFRAEIAQHAGLLGGGLALRRCPRVHLKAVIVDGALLYLGSANWTGAGLGAKGSGRRNFELGFVTDDGPLLDQVQGLYERIWTGGECAGCRLREACPGPLDEASGQPLVKLRKPRARRAK